MPMKFTKKSLVVGSNKRMDSNLATRLCKKLTCNNIAYEKDYCKDHEELIEVVKEAIAKKIHSQDAD